jgi:hypothetical protein
VSHDEGLAYEEALRQGGERLLREASAYFGGRGRLHGALRQLVERLDAAAIPYALLDALALAEHGYPRLTEDIGLLLTPEGLQRFRQVLVGRGYRPAFPEATKTFRDVDRGVRIEIITTGEFPGDGRPKPVAFPDPGDPGVAEEIAGVRIVRLPTLIELKLASGTLAPHRLRDLADVQDLIIRLELPLSLGDGLDPSVQGAYQDLWNRAQEGRA